MFCVKCREESDVSEGKFRRAVGRLITRSKAAERTQTDRLCPVHAAKTVAPSPPPPPKKDVVEEDVVLLDADGHIISPEVDRLIQEMREYVRSDGITPKREMPLYSALHPVEVVDMFK